MRNVPFTPGTAREIKDPEAEVARLAAQRSAPDVVAVPRGDLAVLVALAHAGAASFASYEVEKLPGGVTIDDAVAVLERYITH